MSSYWSALLTTTTARVASIRQNLLPSEDDGDTEDDTHICRVLRSHYTEIGRSFPAWLPPDPRAPPSSNPQPSNMQSKTSSKYGVTGVQPAASTSFASLFSTGNGNEQQPPQEELTLRQGRRMKQDPNSSNNTQTYNMAQSGIEPPMVRSRPLPSKMAGSYQNSNVGMKGTNQSTQSLGALNGRPMSAKDRLKAGNLRRPDPRTTNTTESYSYRNTGNGRSDKPFVAATSPWASNEDEFGGAGYEPPARTKPRGLPAGPASGRKIGLPSGPRGKR